MNLRTTLLTILLVTGITFQSCSDEEACLCCTTGEYKGFFDIQAIGIKHWNIENRQIEEPEISFEEYGYINLHFIVDYLVHQPSRQFGFSLMNSAYGCSPIPPGKEGSKEEALESLQIISINDYDEDHRAGESLNDLLELKLPDYDEPSEPILLEDFLNTFTENVPSEYFFLKLLKEPTLNQDFQVRVVVNLSTGEEYEATSEMIKFI